MHEARYLGSLEPLASSAAGRVTHAFKDEPFEADGARKVPARCVTDELRSGQQPVAETVPASSQ